ncbi:MAG: xanthine dehydrogenase family protein, partial [Lachnospiraceae bacterium]|nr:xanthine dehydrogenase family protein [Lachnospiraceae bacterium]
MEKKQDFKYITKRMPRIEGKALALGKPYYMADRLRPGYVVIKAVHCPYPSAECMAIDSKVAEKVPGFVRLVTWEDTPIQTNFGWPYTPWETKVLKKVCRFEGDVCALVVAETEEAAEKIHGLLKIEWKVKEPLLDFRDALKGEIVVHEDQLDELNSQTNFSQEETRFAAEHNQVAAFQEEWGDTDAVLASCDHVTEVFVHTSQQIHTQLETHRCYSYYDDRGFLTIEAPTQAVDAMQEDVARSLGIDRRKLRVIKTQVGGGFGGKNIFSPYCWCALVTLLTKRPAVLIFSREEAMIGIGTRHEYDMRLKHGADRDGTFRAIDSWAIENAGAYSEISFDVLETGIHNTYSMFPRVDALRLDQHTVYTNKIEGCAFRGFGATQNAFLLNVAARHLADELKLDLPEVFKKNISRIGDSHPVMNGWREDDPAVVQSTKLAECIDRSMEMIDWEHTRNRELPKGNIVRGVGIG